MPVAKVPPKLALANEPTAVGTWLTLEMSARMHKGLSRTAKAAGNKELSRYHHGFEEGLLKAMKVIVEKFGKEV